MCFEPIISNRMWGKSGKIKTQTQTQRGGYRCILYRNESMRGLCKQKRCIILLIKSLNSQQQNVYNRWLACWPPNLYWLVRNLQNAPYYVYRDVPTAKYHLRVRVWCTLFLRICRIHRQKNYINSLYFNLSERNT